MREPPNEIFYAATEKLPEEKFIYGPKRPCRLYGTINQARLFLSYHKNRSCKLWRGTVSWEEVKDVG